MGKLTLVAATCLALLLMIDLPRRFRGSAPQQAPPDLGATVLENALRGPGLVSPSRCRREGTFAAFQDGSLLMRVAGKCSETQLYPAVAATVDGLTVPDGEVSVEIKVADDARAGAFAISMRRPGRRAEAPDGIYGGIDFARGNALIVRWVMGESTVLAERNDLTGLRRDDWNRLAVRADWPRLWLILNDEPILSATDGMFDGGHVALHTLRFTQPDDSAEVAVLVRNLRVSDLAAALPERAPVYRRS